MSNKSKGQHETHERQGESGVSARLTYLLIGAGLGAIIALLFAPKSGSELRGDIADVTRKGIDRTREGARYVGDKAGEYYGATREKVGDWYGSARDTASRRREQYEAAIEAGKQAYRDEKRRRETQAASELGGDEIKDDYISG